ncbi:MAG: hypothetical protein ACI9K3_000784, partial [Halovenus sp.]
QNHEREHEDSPEYLGLTPPVARLTPESHASCFGVLRVKRAAPVSGVII